MQAFLVAFGGRQFDVVDAAPRFTAVDQLGLIGGVDRFGEGVVIANATRPDRGAIPSSASRSV